MNNGVILDLNNEFIHPLWRRDTGKVFQRGNKCSY